MVHKNECYSVKNCLREIQIRCFLNLIIIKNVNVFDGLGMEVTLWFSVYWGKVITITSFGYVTNPSCMKNGHNSRRGGRLKNRSFWLYVLPCEHF